MDLIANGLNILLAVGTIGLGLFGWLKPSETMDYLGIAATDDTGLGRSEIRAASGALWVGAGVASLLIFNATAFVMLASLWTGAAIGRGTAVFVDKANRGKPVIFFAVEAAFAVLLLVINLPRIL